LAALALAALLVSPERPTPLALALLVLLPLAMPEGEGAADCAALPVALAHTDCRGVCEGEPIGSAMAAAVAGLEALAERLPLLEGAPPPVSEGESEALLVPEAEALPPAGLSDPALLLALGTTDALALRRALEVCAAGLPVGRGAEGEAVGVGALRALREAAAPPGEGVGAAPPEGEAATVRVTEPALAVALGRGVAEWEAEGGAEAEAVEPVALSRVILNWENWRVSQLQPPRGSASTSRKLPAGSSTGTVAVRGTLALGTHRLVLVGGRAPMTA
jgi:hypothetical protein